MLIRVVATLSLLVLGTLVLYLPSTTPADHFLRQIRIEHGLSAQQFGPAVADAALSRTVAWLAKPPTASDVGGTPPSVGNPVIIAQVAALSERLQHNPYLLAINALLALATFRLCLMLEWLALLMPFTVLCLCDGAMLRVVKSREFRAHDPEVMAACSVLSIVLACALLILLVMPRTLPPVWLVAIPAIIAGLLGRAVANFHRRA